MGWGGGGVERGRGGGGGVKLCVTEGKVDGIDGRGV